MEGDKFFVGVLSCRMTGWPAEQCLLRQTLQTKKVCKGKIRAAAEIILRIIPMLVVPAEFGVLGRFLLYKHGAQ